MRWALVVIGLVVILTGPDESGKRKIGKEIHKMETFKKNREAVIKYL